MTEILTTYDPAEDLRSDLAILAFVAEGLETVDSGYIAHALEVVVRAKVLAADSNSLPVQKG